MEKVENREVERELHTIEKKKSNFKKLAALAAIGFAGSAFAADTPPNPWGNSDDSFGDLLYTFENYMEGNLGKILALLGFVGTFVIYLMTHKGSVLFIGVVISLIAGGLVGIVATFFNAGSSAFTIHE